MCVAFTHLLKLQIFFLVVPQLLCDFSGFSRIIQPCVKSSDIPMKLCDRAKYLIQKLPTFCLLLLRFDITARFQDVVLNRFKASNNIGLGKDRQLL